LLHPFLFGDPNNLVNSQNPFGKYVPVGPSDKEVLASYWYSKTYDKYITDPETQFLLPLEMYLDKTGKTTGMTSYCGEPLIWASVLLSYTIRQDHETWPVQGYINDLEKTSSAKKTLSSGRKGEMGRTLRNYHKVAAAVLQSVVDCQNKGGFDGYVCMGDEVRYMRIIPIFAFLKGDGKSGDAVVARYGGKNCKMRVPRLCHTSLDKLDDPLHACPWMVGEHLERLYAGATQRAPTRELERERRCYLQALTDTSTHVCDNAFSKLDFGYNPFGITLATPLDMMHAFESGIMPRVLNCFIASMGTTVRVAVDDLIEDMFKQLRSTIQSEFVRVNFVRGPTSLTLLSSHEWPRITFTFLLVLLSPKGRQICQDCFQDDNVPENDHDWESAPGVDLSNTYVPPILIDQARGTAARGSATYNNEEEREHQEDEFVYEDDDGTSTVANGGNKPKGPVKMMCSHRQFANLLIELLLFHAWYKYGNAPFGPEYQARWRCRIREGKSPDDKKNSAFSTKFFANFHYFCVLFPSSRRISTKPQHLSMCHYIAKKLSGIIIYILRQSHVMHQLVLLNLVVIHIIIVVTHVTIDGQPRRQYIITFGPAYGSGQPFLSTWESINK
jgi:hypothetical protein